MVRFLIRMNASLKNYIHANQRAQIHTAAELHYYALESGFQCEKLTFCKSDFAASNRVRNKIVHMYLIITVHRCICLNGPSMLCNYQQIKEVNQM